MEGRVRQGGNKSDSKVQSLSRSLIWMFNNAYLRLKYPGMTLLQVFEGDTQGDFSNKIDTFFGLDLFEKLEKIVQEWVYV